MNNVLSRLAVLCSLTMLAGTAQPAVLIADSGEAWPVAVLAFSGFGEFNRDLQFLAKLSGEAETAAAVEKWLGQLTKGPLAAVDFKRPWGIVFGFAESSRFEGVGFLPVVDFRKLVTTFSQIFGEPIAAGGGVYQFERGESTYFLKQNGDWAYWTQQKRAFDALSGDPLAQLGNLNQQYDLAVRLNVQNIPPDLRGPAAAFIKQWLETTLPQSPAEKGDKPQASPAGLARGTIARLVDRINDLNRLTVGLDIDRAKSSTDLDLEVTAVPGSDTARAFTTLTESRRDSSVSGVLLPDAIFSLHLNSPFLAPDEEQAEAILKSLFSQALDEIADGDGVDAEQRAKIKKLAGNLSEIFGETIEKDRRINLGLALTDAGSVDEFGDLLHNAVENAFPNRVQETIIGAGQATVVASGRTADGAKLEKVALQMAAILADVSGQGHPKLNIDKHEGRTFHAFSVMAPQTMRAQWPLRMWRNLLGNPLKITLAFGKDTFYLALGEKGAAALKRVIDNSAAREARPPAITASLGLAPIWKLIAVEGRSPRAAMLAKNLKAAGKDRITFTVEPVRDGVRYRLQGQEGLNMLLGGSVGAAARALTTSGQE